MLTDLDKFAIARWASGLGWEKLPVSPLTREWLNNAPKVGHIEFLRILDTLMPGSSETILAIDPNAEPPRPKVLDISAEVPDLPKALRLTPDQERQAQDVGIFLNEFVDQIGTVGNEVPLSYIQFTGLWLGSVAIGRRMRFNPPWIIPVFPNMYGVLIGVSSYYHKSFCMHIAGQIIRHAMPHMLISRPGSSENFKQILAGRIPLDDLAPNDKAIAQRAIPFAAQRALLRDELSGLFNSMTKDHMREYREDLLEMYDCPEGPIALTTNGKGMAVIRNAAFSLFGASTPSAMSSAISDTDWEDGMFPRFSLIVPEADFKDRPKPKQVSTTLDPFIHVIRTLHEMLPQPPTTDMLGNQSEMPIWSLAMPEMDLINGYHDALREMIREDAPIDNRLRGCYGRHSDKLVKVVILLAALDWAADPKLKKREDTLKVKPGHVYRALQIVEQWRVMTHRTLRQLSEGNYTKAEKKVKDQLTFHEELTKSELLRKTNLPAQTLDAVLASMVDSAELIQDTRKTGGREAKVYILPNSANFLHRQKK
jgi:hypothetical protein